MEINTSAQLALEQALAGLIPYLQSLDDPDGVWDFLDDVFPTDYTFIAGHEAKELPKEKSDFLAFIASLPDYRRIGPRYPSIRVRMELVTGILNAQTRDADVVTHSRRAAALLRLFSMRYFDVLREVLLPPEIGTDNRPWKGIGFDAWNADPEQPEDGIAPSGNAYVANPAYTFLLHFESEPQT